SAGIFAHAGVDLIAAFPESAAGVGVLLPPHGQQLLGWAVGLVGALTPDLYVEYFRDLSELPVNERGLLDPTDIGRTMAAYATEVIR
ncbi:MAG TPA: hypothetical protein VGF64_07965, partial [Acidimicrobiales bacterium]